MSEKLAPFVDMVQEALARPDKRLFLMRHWNDAKKDMGASAILNTRLALDQAKVFKLSDEFVRVSADASMMEPAVILNALSNARLPYDKMWVEWDEEVRMKALGGFVGLDTALRIGAFMERMAGYDDQFLMHMFWIHRKEHPQLPELGGEAKVFLSMLSVVWNTSDQVKQVSLANTEEELPEEVFELLFGRMYYQKWGGFGEGKSAKDRIYLNQISSHIGINFGIGWKANIGDPSVLPAVTGEEREKLMRTVHGSVIGLEGDIRFMITVLSLLQTKWTDKVITRESAGKRNLPSLRTNWLDVHECVITAPKERIIHLYPRKMATGALRRRHDVMGHFCYKHGTGLEDCVHNYIENEFGQEVCTNCHSTRWWRASHQRGSLDVGKVSKTYRVDTP